MANFAQINDLNIVSNIVKINNSELIDENGVEQEQKGIDFCKSLFGQDTKWKQTSYNNNFRKNYAGVGHIYDEARDAFIEPKPYNSWTLNESTCKWEAPIPYPHGQGRDFAWNESTMMWE